MQALRGLGRRRWAEARATFRSTDFEAFADLGSRANRRLLLLLFAGLGISAGILGTLALVPYAGRLGLPVSTTVAIGVLVVALGGAGLLLPAGTPMVLIDLIAAGAVVVVTVAASQSPGPVAGYTALFYVWVMIPLVMLRSSRATLVHFTFIAGASGVLYGLDDTFTDGLFWWTTVLLSLAVVWQSTGWLVRRGRELAVRERQARARAEEVSAALEQVNEQKSRFLAAVSHELRTPLNAVMGFGEMLRREVAGPLTSQQREYVDDITRSGRHLLDLIDDTLDVAKVETGRDELELEEVALDSLVADAVRLVRPAAIQAGIDLGVSPSASGSVMVDERRIRQVLVNLLSNAVKFTPRDGHVRVEATRRADVVEISVSDTGTGVDPSAHDSIFEEFRQSETPDHQPEPDHRGAGLGLAMCRRFVELHGGRIWVESALGAGARFTFSLPGQPRPERPAGRPRRPGGTGGRAPAAVVLKSREVLSRAGVFAVYVGIGSAIGALIIDTPGVSTTYLWVAVGVIAFVLISVRVALATLDDRRLWVFGRVHMGAAEVFTAFGVYHLGPMAPIAIMAWVGQSFFVRFFSLRVSALVHWLNWAALGVMLAVVLAVQDGNTAPVAQWMAAAGTLWIASFLVGWLFQRFRVLATAEQAAAVRARRVAAELSEVSRHKSQFLAGMSHELRTPLNAVIGLGQVLEREMAGPIGPRQREYAHDIVESGRHLLELVNDVLDLARIEAGRLELRPDRVAVGPVVEEALGSARLAAEAKGIRLLCEVDQDMSVHADRHRITQALSALVSNAVKFSPPGATVTITASQTTDAARLSVRDEGPGIAPHRHQVIFEPFHQHPAGPDRATEGAGLGLALARELVALHTGAVSVESVPGEGSTFTIVLPTPSAEDDATAALAPEVPR